MTKTSKNRLKRLMKEVGSTGQVMSQSVDVMDAAVTAFMSKLIDRAIEVATNEKAKSVQPSHVLSVLRLHTEYDFLLEQPITNIQKRRRRTPTTGSNALHAHDSSASRHRFVEPIRPSSQIRVSTMKSKPELLHPASKDKLSQRLQRYTQPKTDDDIDFDAAG